MKLKAVARSGVSTCEGNDKIRKSLGHDFPGASLEGSYCRNCGCGTSFAPSYSDPDFQPCPRTREVPTCTLFENSYALKHGGL